VDTCDTDPARSRGFPAGTGLAAAAGMSTMAFAYRDDTDGVRIHYEDLRERWDAARTALSGAASVHARRTGRIWAGTAGMAGAAGVFGATALRFLGDVDALAGVPTALLPVSWLAMAVAYAAGIVVADARLRAFTDPPRRTGDVRADTVRIEEALPRVDQRARVDAMEQASVVLPMIATALLAPLSIHLVAYVAMGHMETVADQFDKWIAVSAVVVGHAHLALAYLAWRFARAARAATVDGVTSGVAGSGFRAWGITVIVSALPSALLFLIPPALTAVTGVLFIPAMWGMMTRRIARERLALDVA
jgi:hypothetical protein